MRWRPILLLLRIALFALGVVAPAAAQTSEELAAARKLFAEALKDEEQHLYDVALEKFQRVQKVRDTAPIRYRIGSCQEGLGHLRQAAVAYQGAIALGKSEPKDQEVVKGAKGRLATVERKMAKLTVSMPESAHDAQLRIDDEPVAQTELARPIPLDPGKHTVSATAKDAAPFRTEISLPEGGHVSLSIALDPVAGIMKGQANETSPPTPPKEQPANPGDSSGTRTIGYVVAGAGAALLIGGAVTLLMRHAEIATLNKDCPNGVCPASERDQLTSGRSRALVEGPLGVGLGAAGLVALGVGAYLVSSSGSSSASSEAPPAESEPAPAALLPWISPQGGGLAVGGAFR
jgi:hypothetical protein